MGETPKLDVPISAWLALAVVITCGLVIEALAHRDEHHRGRRSAIVWSAAWITLGLAFGGWVALRFGVAAGEDYLTAFLVEKSLSVDDLFVILIVFQRLDIPAREQHRVLQWGVPVAVVMRAFFIAIGAAAIGAWHEVVYFLGAFLVLTGVRMGLNKDGAWDERRGGLLPILQRHLPIATKLDGRRFLTIENGRRVATPLLVALIAIELTDLICAIEGVPALFAITDTSFILYSSNMFALLGLHALYLVLADLLAALRYLRYGLAAILVLAGMKMLVSGFVHIPHVVSLLMTSGILIATIVPSLIVRQRASAA